MTDLEFAREFSKRIHEGQVDKAGVDYWKHPDAVAAMCSTDEEKIVAYLHDVVEDTEVTVYSIRKMFGDTVGDAVYYITHSPGMPYMEQIKRLAVNDIARRVKIADLTHNMDLSRLKEVTERDLKRTDKYRRAKEYLMNYGGCSDAAAF